MNTATCKHGSSNCEKCSIFVKNGRQCNCGSDAHPMHMSFGLHCCLHCDGIMKYDDAVKIIDSWGSDPPYPKPCCIKVKEVSIGTS